LTTTRTKIGQLCDGIIGNQLVRRRVSLDRSTTLSATHIPQLFSDRTYCPGTGSGLCLTQQRCDIFEADQLGVTISEVTSFVIAFGTPVPPSIPPK
jgi:hypothetical protein